ncbi:hypothetical protein PIB30_075389 [Stylosanthes scabra]|uniref:Snakin-2 n=1 Tax=Stylosanthes scabra TaxID=79078 RepID=A0ABU6WNA9_9FABA|nr:hypothetical protein [Stylosanthes scabra]
MTLTKLVPTFLILSFLLLHHLVEANHQLVSPEISQGSLSDEKIDCNGACDVRCSKTSRVFPCKRACLTCCRRCNCVPPGTYGNEEACPCYFNQTTHHGKRKCP